MAASPKVDFSVIIPTRNRPQSLADCLEALTKLHAAPRFEVIVVDDGGSCDLKSVVEPWREELRLSLLRICHSGPAAARNAGAQAARGRWLAFTDDDCMPAPNWLAAFAAVIGGTPHLLVGGRTENLLGDNLIRGREPAYPAPRLRIFPGWVPRAVFLRLQQHGLAC